MKADLRLGWVGDLSPRNHEVMNVLAKGATHMAAAECLEMSTTRIQQHVNAVIKHCGAQNEKEAIALYCDATGRLSAYDETWGLANKASEQQQHVLYLVLHRLEAYCVAKEWRRSEVRDLVGFVMAARFGDLSFITEPARVGVGVLPEEARAWGILPDDEAPLPNGHSSDFVGRS